MRSESFVVEDEEAGENGMQYGLEAYEEPLTECFDEYESYVDAAVGRLRAEFKDRALKVNAQLDDTSELLVKTVDEQAEVLGDSMDSFVNRTVRITQSSGEELKDLVGKSFSETKSAVAKSCEGIIHTRASTLGHLHGRMHAACVRACVQALTHTHSHARI